MTDDEILLAFMQSDLNVRSFARQQYNKGATVTQLIYLKDKLMQIAGAKISARPEKYTIEFYRCDSCDLPHRIVYKHSDQNRCPICKLGDIENPSMIYYLPMGFLKFKGKNEFFMNTVIHAMNIEINGIPMEFDQEYLDKLKVEIVEHDYSNL